MSFEGHISLVKKPVKLYSISLNIYSTFHYFSNLIGYQYRFVPCTPKDIWSDGYNSNPVCRPACLSVCLLTVDLEGRCINNGRKRHKCE